MTPPSTSDLLEAWERGLGLPPAERPLALLAAGAPSASAEEIARLPLGQRDAGLLDLREWAFGSSITGTASCPECGVDLELPVEVGEVRMASAADAAELRAGPDSALRVAGHEIDFHLPNSLDLREAARAADLEQARTVLLERCVLSASRDGSPVDASALPAAALERLEQALAERNAEADVRFAVTCPDCRHKWEVEFDVGVFLWREIDQWARRLLVDVATLASAFGWTEDEVLRLGPERRGAYLELVGR